MSGLTGAELVKLIQDIRDAKYGLTAFYIDTEKTGGRSLTQYF